MSKTDLRMERRENMRDRTGTEGRHATLPRESSTQDEERGWSQGRVRIPLDISHTIMIICSVDSVDPTIAFSSVVFCSKDRNFNLSLFVGKLFLIINNFKYIRVGRNGNNITNSSILVTRFLTVSS